MSNRKLLSKLVLLPISKVYGLGARVRNFMFDMRILKEKDFDVPVVVVGNLAVGGTGKTPHVEYLAGELRHSFHLAVLSRGYKRSTRGFVMATRRSTPSDIGDEPYQIYHKFDCEVTVAVCEDRVAGITELLRIDPQIDLLILDDAFQHRYVHPTVSVVLTEYNRPVFADKMLPYGRLREPKSSLKRADIVVATKCPDRPTALDLRIFEDNLKLMPWQRLYFSRLVYSSLRPVFPDAAPAVAPALEWLTADDMLLCVAGIANPRPFVKFVKHFQPRVRVNIFPDHHNFTRKDMALLLSRFETMAGRRNFLITTEKDAVRMANCPYFPHQLKPCAYYLPIKVDFIRDDKATIVEAIRKIIKNKKG